MIFNCQHVNHGVIVNPETKYTSQLKIIIVKINPG